MPSTKTTEKKNPVKTVHEIDAAGQVVGRLATKIATILIGKHRAAYVPHMDSGDIVKVTNAHLVVLTGKKWEQKKHYRTSNRPGGLKAVTMQKLKQENPSEILRHAVKYMLPKNRTQAVRLKRLIIS